MTAPTFRIAREALAMALGRLQLALSTRATLPVLGHALVETQADAVVMSSTDLDHWIRLRVPAADVVPGIRIALPVRRLADIVAQLPPATIALSVTDRRACLEAGRSRFALTGMAPDEFPTPTWPQGPDADLDGRALTAAIAAAAPHLSHADSRPSLNGVLFEATDDGIEMVATDGFRLLRQPLSLTTALRGEFIISRSALPAIRKLFSEAERVDVRAAGGTLSLARPAVEFMTRLIEGPYPAWRQLFMQPTVRQGTMDRAALVASLRRILALPPQDDYVLMRWNATELELSAQHPDFGRAEDVQSTSFAGDDGSSTEFRQAVNGRFLLELLESMTAESIRVRTEKPGRAAFIDDADGRERAVGLVQPLRLRD